MCTGIKILLKSTVIFSQKITHTCHSFLYTKQSTTMHKKYVVEGDIKPTHLEGIYQLPTYLQD